MTAPTVERRLAAFRASRDRSPAGAGPTAARLRRGDGLAERLAAAVDGEWLRTPLGNVVRREPRDVAVPLERARLARLPGQPGPDVPLVCLDTETTGLGTAAGNVAFLVGLGWWEGPRFRGLQLLLPDHADEPALLAALDAAIPAGAWLVTYNGRCFDWPLLVTRYRLLRRAAPDHAGMLDLLPHVRRLFRHRLGDARLATVERELLGVRRVDDVAGWEIPGRYLDFLRGGSAAPLAAVVAHNEEDVRSLARLLAHLDARYGDRDRRRAAPPGDLVALARGFTRERRHAEALDCLDAAATGLAVGTEGPMAAVPATRPDPGWPAARPLARWPAPTIGPDRVAAERARTLRRLGRPDAALAAWKALARRGGPLAATAWIEVAKLHEHAEGDPAAALAAADAAGRILEQVRLVGRSDARLEAALAVRRRRLRARLLRAS